jgi:hypothetical protein
MQKTRLAGLLRRHGWALALYIGIALLYTYPLVLHLGDRLAGQGADALQGYWNMWWTRQALLEMGHNPFETPLMHHPFGLSLYFHTHNFLNALLSLPVQVCCGTTTAFNLVALAAPVLAGVGAYALVWYLTRQPGAAFVAGLVYAFSPYMVLPLHMGHLHLLSTGWLPLYLLALLCGLRERRVCLVLAAFVLLLIGLTDWHYTLYAILLTLLVGLYEALRLRQGRSIVLLFGKLSAVGALFTLAMLPVVVPAILELSGDPYAARGLWHSRLHSADLLAFVMPNIFHPLWGEWASDLFYGRLMSRYVVGGVVMLGYVPLALALLALLRDRQRGGLFVLVFGVFFVLALGPYLKFNGVNTYDTAQPVPLPYILFHQMPFMSVHRAPSRFFVGVLLALAVLAGLGVRWLWQQQAITRLPAWGRRAVLGGIAALVLFEYWPQPLPMTDLAALPVSPFLATLAAQPGNEALLQVPYPADTSPLLQTIHGRPVVGGTISRTPPHPLDDARFFGPLLDVDPDMGDVGSDDSPRAARSALRCQDVRYVLFYKQERFRAEDPDDPLEIEQRLFAGIEPVYDDALLRVYEAVNQQPQVPYWTLSPGEWYDGQTNEQGTIYRWAEGQQGALLIYPCRQQEQPQRAVVHMNMFGFAASRSVSIGMDDRSAAEVDLPPDTVRRVSLLVPLHAGENRLLLRSQEPARPAAAQGYEDDERLLSFNLSQVSVTTYEIQDIAHENGAE